MIAACKQNLFQKPRALWKICPRTRSYRYFYSALFFEIFFNPPFVLFDRYTCQILKSGHASRGLRLRVYTYKNVSEKRKREKRSSRNDSSFSFFFTFLARKTRFALPYAWPSVYPGSLFLWDRGGLSLIGFFRAFFFWPFATLSICIHLHTKLTLLNFNKYETAHFVCYYTLLQFGSLVILAI